MKQSDLPSWALDYKAIHGGTLRKRGNTIYVYRKTSKREASSKYPVSREIYQGILTQEHGLIPPNRTLVDTNHMVWAEYGWTRIMLEKTPDSWMKAAGKNAEVLLHACIIKSSPHSYLTALYPSGFDKQIEAMVKPQTVSLHRRQRDELKIDHKEIEIFKNLLILCDKADHYMLTEITDEMSSIASKLGVDLKVVNKNEIRLKITV